MRVDETTVLRIARLARIKITEDEAKGLEKELSGILNWVEQLNSVDTAVGRADDARRSHRAEEAHRRGQRRRHRRRLVKNAPLVEDHYFVVPKVVE